MPYQQRAKKHDQVNFNSSSKSIFVTNWMPYVVKVALREISHLTIFGNDYATKDRTGQTIAMQRGPCREGNLPI